MAARIENYGKFMFNGCPILLTLKHLVTCVSSNLLFVILRPCEEARWSSSSSSSANLSPLQGEGLDKNSACIMWYEYN